MKRWLLASIAVAASLFAACIIGPKQDDPAITAADAGGADTGDLEPNDAPAIDGDKLLEGGTDAVDAPGCTPDGDAACEASDADAADVRDGDADAADASDASDVAEAG